MERVLGNNLHKVMTDNMCELSMGDMCKLCKHESIKLNMTVLYHPASNGVAEQAIGVLTNSVLANAS